MAGKKIILLADGTGNAFSTQESNVWRLFEAIDTGQSDQIAYYIEGVGTSSFRPWALFDGATGLGVPANVRKLYRFLCWNWERGDEIYMFGFSRGAFTIRLLIGLIRSQGLMPRSIGGRPVTHGQMRVNVDNAWRVYGRRGSGWYSKINPVVFSVRFLRDLILFLWHRATLQYFYDIPFRKGRGGAGGFQTVTEAVNSQGLDGKHVKIKFVGLFDTVEAFGVPIDELRAGIDYLIWPIRFPNNRMSHSVLNVRHALSLDDERRTFAPIRIDKDVRPPGAASRLYSQALASMGAVLAGSGRLASAQLTATPAPADQNRIQEVWFVGAHSNVGGGYPDDELARVPLLWMMSEMQVVDCAARVSGTSTQPDLRYRPGAIEEFKMAASPFGTLNDSRAGLGVFYRFSPRAIEQEVWTPRHPRRGGSASPIVLRDVVVHESVVDRLVDGSDRYAPLTLPNDARVWSSSGPPATLAAVVATRLAASGKGRSPTTVEYQESADSVLAAVLLREGDYLAMLALLLIIAFFPLLIGDARDDSSAAVLSGTIGALKNVTPSYAAPYLDALLAEPKAAAILCVLLFLAYWAGKALREVCHDSARGAWVVDRRGVAIPHRGLLTRIGAVVRRFRNAVKAYAPQFNSMVSFASGVVVLVGAIALVGIVASRTFFNFRHGLGELVCASSPAGDLKWIGAAGVANEVEREFSASSPCWASGRVVEKGVAYRLEITITKPWLDLDIFSDVEGFAGASLKMKLMSVMRRWPFAGWFQPIARIGASGDAEWPVAANDGSGPVSSDPRHCARTTVFLDAKQKLCDGQSGEPCRGLDGWRKPLTAPIFLAAANCAWGNHRGEWKAPGPEGKTVPCESAYPRTRLVSDFVAQKTGEFFLFVNDALPFLLQPDDAYYANNNGAAKISIKRLTDGGTSPAVGACDVFAPPEGH